MDFSKLNCMKPLLSRRSESKASSLSTETNFTVKYIGNGRLEKPGLKDMCEFVKKSFKAYTNEGKEKDVVKRHVVISGQEMLIRAVSGQGVELPSVVFKIRRIQFCGVYQGNPKIFFFTYQFGKTAEIVECHILMCKSRKDAKKIAKRAQILFKDLTFSLHRPPPGETKGRTKVAKLEQLSQSSSEETTAADNTCQDLLPNE